MKKLLNLTSVSVFPPQTGGSQLIYSFVTELSRMYEVSLITVRADRDEESRKKMGSVKIYDVLSRNSLIKFFTLSSFLGISRVIGMEKPDCMIIDFPWFGIYGFWFKKIYGIPYIIHEHNIEFIRFQRLKKWWWNILRYYEKFVYRHASAILCISDVDREILIRKLKISPGKIIDCPYGVDEKIFKPKPEKQLRVRQNAGIGERPFILFFGSLDYPPNRQAVKIIKNEIYSRVKKVLPDAVFVVVGRNPPAGMSDEDIVYTGYCPDITAYIQSADVVIVPLVAGGGIRTKIIESLACGKTVISTSVGAEGIDTVNFPRQLILSDTWEDFSEKIVSVIMDCQPDMVSAGIKKYLLKDIVNSLHLDRLVTV